MKKVNICCYLLILALLSCHKEQHVWEYKILPGTCYADALEIKPEYSPRGYYLEITGELQQDVTVSMLGYTINELHQFRGVSLNSFQRFKRGHINFSNSSELYVQELKLIVAGSDTLYYPYGSGQSNKCKELGDVRIKVTLL